MNTISYATPPGWRPAPLPTTLRRAAASAAATARRPAPRPAPPARRNPSGADPAVEFGFPWWLYLVGVVAFTAAALGIVALTRSTWNRDIALVAASVGWAVCLRGLSDFARRGAAS
jgi:hypothetical protein